MKYLFILLLIASTGWLGMEYYQNGKTIDEQARQIEALKQMVIQLRDAQQSATPPRPQFRLDGNRGAGSTSTKSNDDHFPDRRFKRPN